MTFVSDFYSQTHDLRKRKQAGLHPVDEMSRFRKLVCALFCGVCVSLVYAFDLFTTKFSDVFGLSAGDLSTISTVGVVFCYSTFPFGFLFDYMGPTPLFACALVLGLLGCLCLGLVFDGVIVGNTATISVFYAMMNLCSGLLDSAAIVTLVELFPRNRGPVVGLAKVMTGLGSSILSSFRSNFFGDNVSGFIYFIMCLCVVIAFFAMTTVTLPTYFINGWRRRGKTEEELAELASVKELYETKFVPARRLAVGYVVAACLVVFFAVSSPVVAYTTVSSAGHYVLGAITIILCLCFLLMAMPISALGGVNEPAPNTLPAAIDEPNSVEKGAAKVGAAPAEVDVSSVEATGNMVSDATVSSPASPTVDVVDAANSSQDPRYDGGLVKNLCRPDIWLILIMFVCQGAIGTLVTYNASTIYIAKTGEPRTEGLAALYTAFLGVGSSLGRVSAGLFEAFVQHQPPENRRFVVTLALPLGPLLGTIAGVLILVIPGKALLLPYLLVYFGDGMFNGLRALLFPCLFESCHGIYYNMAFLSSVVTVIGFNRFLFGNTIDSQHDKLGYAKGEECKSIKCIQTPFIVVTCTAAAAVVTSCIIHIRYSRYVRKTRAALRREANKRGAVSPCEPAQESE